MDKTGGSVKCVCWSLAHPYVFRFPETGKHTVTLETKETCILDVAKGLNVPVVCPSPGFLTKAGIRRQDDAAMKVAGLPVTPLFQHPPRAAPPALPRPGPLTDRGVTPAFPPPSCLPRCGGARGPLQPCHGAEPRPLFSRPGGCRSASGRLRPAAGRGNPAPRERNYGGRSERVPLPGPAPEGARLRQRAGRRLLLLSGVTAPVDVATAAGQCGGVEALSAAGPVSPGGGLRSGASPSRAGS